MQQCPAAVSARRVSRTHRPGAGPELPSRRRGGVNTPASRSPVGQTDRQTDAAAGRWWRHPEFQPPSLRDAVRGGSAVHRCTSVQTPDTIVEPSGAAPASRTGRRDMAAQVTGRHMAAQVSPHAPRDLRDESRTRGPSSQIPARSEQRRSSRLSHRRRGRPASLQAPLT